MDNQLHALMFYLSSGISQSIYRAMLKRRKSSSDFVTFECQTCEATLSTVDTIASVDAVTDHSFAAIFDFDIATVIAYVC